MSPGPCSLLPHQPATCALSSGSGFLYCPLSVKAEKNRSPVAAVSSISVHLQRVQLLKTGIPHPPTLQSRVRERQAGIGISYVSRQCWREWARDGGSG